MVVVSFVFVMNLIAAFDMNIASKISKISLRGTRVLPYFMMASQSTNLLCITERDVLNLPNPFFNLSANLKFSLSSFIG